MKGITIKLPEETLRRLRQEARATGRCVAALVRERVETPLDGTIQSVYTLTSDLAGSLAGGRNSATNARRRFRRKRPRPPLLTCEAVLTEAIYFLREDKVPIDPLFQLMERDALVLSDIFVRP